MGSGKGEEHADCVPKVCMTVIGIGYLFPISAIWAAFDYWELLFPKDNIEFTVSWVYQVGSVVTVALLSLAKAFKLGPRILGGFSGQFVCLAAILSFRWLSVPNDVLKVLLLTLVALCSVATGYLDSALLALCSQFGSEMQRKLQIGIGLGTTVSVVYRDATKILLAGRVADATSLYFLFALVTVLICIACYRVLMAHPISAHIVAGDGRRDELPAGCSFVTPTPPNKGQPLLAEEEAQVAAIDDKSPGTVKVEADFKHVWGIVGKNQVVIFMNLFLTTICYPGIITSIPCRQYTDLCPEQWFQTLLLTAYSLSDIVARLFTGYRLGLTHRNIWITVFLRAAVMPLIVRCVMDPSASDTFAFFVISVMGFLNGYCVTLALMLVNEIPRLTDEQRKTSGRISACSVNSGLCLGSVAAAGLASLMQIGQ